MSCCFYRVILEERPNVRVLASAVDDSSTVLARTRTFGSSSSVTRYKQNDMLPQQPRLVYIQLWSNNSDFSEDIVTP